MFTWCRSLWDFKSCCMGSNESRIKKIMQADEDVGKIALAVPILVSKALELFLQDLCSRTYEITLQRGARTVSSSHLKHCIHMYSAFDFLKESVNKVPDIGGSDPMGVERNGTRRRKVLTNGDCDTTEEGKRAKAVMVHHVGRGGRGRGRGRGRGARGSRLSDEGARMHKYEDDVGMCPDDNDEEAIKTGKLEDQVIEKENTGCANSMGVTGGTHDGVGSKEVRQPLENKMEANNEYMGWPFYDMANMGIEPSQLLHLNKKAEPEEEEDYDNYEE